jgi:LPXTG-motif cell wall-anchored protein
MKRTTLRLFAVPLMAGFLLVSAPAVRAAVFQGSLNYSQDRDSNKKKKKQVPEGSTGAILGLAAAVLGGGLLIWRRKKGTGVS